MPSLSLVIPVFNEASIIRHSIQEIVKKVEEINLLSAYQIVIVDDGSVDQTWSILKELSQSYPQLKLIRLTRNFGKESALCAGLDVCHTDGVIVMDADLQHPPELIAVMVESWQKNDVDIIEAIKKSRGDESRLSALSANIFYRLFTRLSGLNLKDASDFKLLDKKVIDAWRQLPEKNLFFRGMSAWLGFKRETIEFDVPERADGESKWGLFSLIQLALTSITAYSSAPLHVITLFGALFTTFSVLLGSYTLFQKFSGEAVSGFTTVIILLLIIGGAIMVALGIIGIYLARIFDEVKNRPRYLVMEQVEPRNLNEL
tara:strand:- start:14301 stop:15248 length:948 start_codon:yes stop_codon:yes gene_type:complete